MGRILPNKRRSSVVNHSMMEALKAKGMGHNWRVNDSFLIK